MRRLAAAIALAFLAAAVPPAYADPEETDPDASKRDEDYAAGKKAVEEKDWARALERFKRADNDTLIYEFTITDPTVWTKPWTVSIPMTRSDEPLYEYACHEGNYAMRNILAGARAAEKAGHAAAKTGSERNQR